MLQLAKDKKAMKGSDKKGSGNKKGGAGAGAGGGASEEDDSGSEAPDRVAIVPLPVLTPEQQLAQHMGRLRTTGYTYLSPNDDDAFEPMSKGAFSGHVVLYYAKGKEGWLRGTLKSPARLKHEIEAGWNWNIQFTRCQDWSVLRLDDDFYINSEHEVRSLHSTHDLLTTYLPV